MSANHVLAIESIGCRIQVSAKRNKLLIIFEYNNIINMMINDNLVLKECYYPDTRFKEKNHDRETGNIQNGNFID